MGRIIIGLLIASAGFAFAIKSEWFYQNFGAIPFAEKYLGTSGGTRLFYKFLGIFLIFIGFLAVTNLHGDLIRWILTPLLRLGNVPETPE